MIKRVVKYSVLLVFIPTLAMTQSVTILGDNTDARDCYFAAQIAVQMQSSSKSDVTTCTRALQTPQLGQRDRAATYINRGILYVALEDYQAAIDDYAKAEELHPEFGALHVNRGNLYFMGQAYDSAIREYNIALQMGVRQQSVAHLNRGMAYEKLGRLREAMADYQQALELAPEWLLVRDKLERVKKKLN